LFLRASIGDQIVNITKKINDNNRYIRTCCDSSLERKIGAAMSAMVFPKRKRIPLDKDPLYSCPRPVIIRENKKAEKGCLLRLSDDIITLFFVFIGMIQ